MVSKQDYRLYSRKHLYSETHVCNTMFLSIAVFICITDPDLHAGGSAKRDTEAKRSRFSHKCLGRRHNDNYYCHDIYGPADDSRVDPEHYENAKSIADEALRDKNGSKTVDCGQSTDYDSKRIASAVLDDPSGLEWLALGDYAKTLALLGRWYLYETMIRIASECKGPLKN